MSSLEARFAEHFREHVVPRLSVRIVAAAAAVKLGYADFCDMAGGLRRFAWRHGAGRLSDQYQTYLLGWIQQELCNGIENPIPQLSVAAWNMLVWQWARHQEQSDG